MTAPPAWAYVAGPFEVWNHRFAIRADSEELGRYLGDLWAACRADVEPRTTYGLDREHRLYADGEVLGQPGNPSIALRDLVRRINADVIAAAGDLVVVHAAGAVRDGAGVLLPGGQESGKTTLVAGLVRDGWDYLSDEAVAIDPETHELLPYPKPLSVDPGSWDVLADLKPPVAEPGESYRSIQWQVAPHCIGRSHDRASSARLLVAVRYAPDEATWLEPVSRARALLHMADSCFTLRQQGRHAMQTLKSLADTCPGFALRFRDLDCARRLLESVLRDR